MNAKIDTLIRVVQSLVPDSSASFPLPDGFELPIRSEGKLQSFEELCETDPGAKNSFVCIVFIAACSKYKQNFHGKRKPR